MSDRKKYIQTKGVRRLKKIAGMWKIIPVLIFILLSLRLTFSRHISGIQTEETLATVAALLFLTLMISIPAVLIWRAVFRQLWLNEVKRATFQSVKDIDYYRDKLTGLSPAEISLLTDLRIETKKDVAATLLQYQLNGIIRIEGSRVEVISSQTAELTESDRLLLELLPEYELNSPELASRLTQWEALAAQEIINGPYIKRAGLRKTSDPRLGCLSAASVPVLSIAAIVLFAYSESFTYVKQVLALLSNSGDENHDLFLLLTTDYKFAIGIAAMLAVFYLLILGFVWPVFWFIRGVVKASAANSVKFRRTGVGEEMTEYIYGLKNFLHDFSNLSEANKDYLALWNDFLIYAVVLEENQIILEEIFGRRGLNPTSFFNPCMN